MKRSAIHLAVMAALVALGVAAILFGEADDAPGLVLFGLFPIAGAALLWFKPALLSAKRATAFFVGAVTLTAIGSLFAGWLEDNF